MSQPRGRLLLHSKDQGSESSSASRLGLASRSRSLQESRVRDHAMLAGWVCPRTPQKQLERGLAGGPEMLVFGPHPCHFEQRGAERDWRDQEGHAETMDQRRSRQMNQRERERGPVELGLVCKGQTRDLAASSPET